MRREGQNAIVDTPREAHNLAVSAAIVLSGEQLWRTPEVNDMWEIGESQDVLRLPLELSVGATRKVIRGLRVEVVKPLTDDGFTPSNIARLRAGVYLRLLDLPRIPGK